MAPHRLKDNRKAATTLRRRFVLTRANGILLLSVVAARLAWVSKAVEMPLCLKDCKLDGAVLGAQTAYRKGEAQAFLGSLQAAWTGSSHLLVLASPASAFCWPL